jgi:hypothetical protein
MIPIQTHYLYDPRQQKSILHMTSALIFILYSQRDLPEFAVIISILNFYGLSVSSPHEETLDAVKLSHRQYAIIVELHQFKKLDDSLISNKGIPAYV